MPYSVGYSVVNINDLKTLNAGDLSDRYLLFVGSKNTWYRWNSNSTLSGDEDSVVELVPPIAQGRWHKTGTSFIPSRTNISHTTPLLAPQARETFSIGLGKRFEILSLNTNFPAWVRVYASAAYRTADANRSINEKPSPYHGIVLDVVTTPSNLTVDLIPMAPGASMEATPNSLISCSVVNLSSSNQTITVNFTKVTLEA